MFNMAKYLIHAYPKRMWYVEQYLIPSMINQGIAKNDISVYNDSKGIGNLRACMEAFASVPDNDEGTWHIQDDVIICKDFKQRTEAHDTGIVCGFSSLFYDGDIEENKQLVKREQMWFSFPCIRIPNKWARECSEWVCTQIIGNPVYKKYWENGVNDDWAFRTYLSTFHKDCVALNIVPCLVDHIDYLIGGGSGKVERNKPVTAQYWTDDDLVRELECQIKENQLPG